MVTTSGVGIFFNDKHESSSWFSKSWNLEITEAEIDKLLSMMPEATSIQKKLLESVINNAKITTTA